MAACQTELNSLPILTGCPQDTETILVMNSSAGGNTGGYGQRFMKDVRQCFLNALKFVLLDFYIGGVGDIIGIGGTTATINQENIIVDSIFVTLSGPELPRSDSTQVSYTVVYNSNSAVITLNQGAQSGQQYIIHYAYGT